MDIHVVKPQEEAVIVTLKPLDSLAAYLLSWNDGSVPKSKEQAKEPPIRFGQKLDKGLA